MQHAKILLVDDEISIMQMVEMVLKKEGFINVLKASTGSEALEIVKRESVDYIVLDVMLPDINGFDLCKKIREYTDVHILFLTARVNDFDVLTGFDKGGDDYVTKPFNPLEIVARIKVQLRRNQKTESKPKVNVKRHDFGHFLVDEEAGELIVEGKVIPCPAQVFKLLVYLCQNVNRVLSKEQLFNAVWGYDYLVDDNTVMVHIRRIRERIEPDPGKPIYLRTVRGLGYKLVKDVTL
ncbi:DNA-binding response OmpR family regulator [Gracilibacillus halotolerans]|uniref:DNA-binding response OmpR family regulator n=1 Tax=Gracilibacillus halotolerans TaxID=74386 RepID=A0A841RIN7_9BACI|nr:response regulator transcription factor [Gracilibacillus halotolerans]MBB6512349.1 DNA-binding response OmpR family regulator [Gracilibacillus halotolerans]